MSYLDTRITREEFILTRGVENTQQSAQSYLNVFDYFCKNIFSKGGDEVIIDIQNAIKEDQNYDRLFKLCNSFVQWLQQDHPEIKPNFSGIEYIKKHNPSSIQIIISCLRNYIEEFGQIEFSERRFSKMVKLPRKIYEEPQPITKNEIRTLIEVASPKRRALYMTLKDSGMRIGEACRLKKKDLDLTTTPVTITIPASYTKTKQGRTTYATRETKPYLERLLAKINDDELVFGSDETSVRKSVKNEDLAFRVFRNNAGLGSLIWMVPAVAGVVAAGVYLVKFRANKD